MVGSEPLDAAHPSGRLDGCSIVAEYEYTAGEQQDDDSQQDG